MTYAAPPPSSSHHAVRPPSNGLATAGFVVALIGAVLSLIPVVGIVSWAISPIGLVLSIVGLALYRSRRTGRGLAIAGIVLGVFGLIMCIVYTASFVNAVSAPPPAYTAPTAAAPNAAAPDPNTTGHYGDALDAGDLVVTAAAPKRVSSALGAQVCSKVTYKNTGSTPHPYNMFDWKFRTSAGTETSPSMSYQPDAALNSGDLNPGGTVSGQVCADNTVKSASAVVYSPGFGFLHQLVWSQ